MMKCTLLFAFEKVPGHIAFTGGQYPPIADMIAIRKKGGPGRQAGLLNMTGGKNKLGEGHRSCAAREFFEETGIQTDPLDWLYFHKERYSAEHAGNGAGVEMYCLAIALPPEVFRTAKTIESEEVSIFSWEQLAWSIDKKLNLNYLIPMAWIHLNDPSSRTLCA